MSSELHVYVGPYLTVQRSPTLDAIAASNDMLVIEHPQNETNSAEATFLPNTDIPGIDRAMTFHRTGVSDVVQNLRSEWDRRSEERLFLDLVEPFTRSLVENQYELQWGVVCYWY